MANRPKGFGMTAELARKKEAKFDPDLATDCFQWLREVLNDGGKGDLASSLPEVCIMGMMGYTGGLGRGKSIWRRALPFGIRGMDMK